MDKDINQNPNSEVALYFIEGIDTNYICINNNSKECIYVPKDYTDMFTSQNDTLYLLQDYDSKNIIQNVFVYNNLFSDTFYLMKPVQNVKPDSTFTYSTQEIYKNELIIQSFNRLCGGEKIVIPIITKKLTRNLKFAKLRCYKQQYDTLQRGFDALYKFEKENSIDLFSEIYY